MDQRVGLVPAADSNHSVVGVDHLIHSSDNDVGDGNDSTGGGGGGGGVEATRPRLPLHTVSLWQVECPPLLLTQCISTHALALVFCLVSMSLSLCLVIMPCPIFLVLLTGILVGSGVVKVVRIAFTP